MAITLSLTSIASRLTTLRHTLLSLVDQSLKPDRIVVYLSHDSYLLDTGISVIPDWLSEMERERQVEVVWCSNTGPYRKLVPSYLASSESDLIVTCDDDVIYGFLWLELLVESAEEYPDHIICGRARVPSRNIFGALKSYINWPLSFSGTEGANLVPIGVAGVVYKKRLLCEAMLVNDDYMTIAPAQDDLWFHFARIRCGAKVFVAPNVDEQVYEIKIPGSTLSAKNYSHGAPGWETYWGALRSRIFRTLKGYMGFDCCENDRAWRKIDSFQREV